MEPVVHCVAQFVCRMGRLGYPPFMGVTTQSPVRRSLVERPTGEQQAREDLVSHVTLGLRPVASPVPLGFFGLAAATLVLSALQLGWIAPGEGRTVALALLGFAFAAQVLTGIVAYAARDVVVATAMSVLGLTWLVSGLVLHDAKPGSTSDGLGVFLLSSGAAVALCGAVACIGKVVPGTVLLVAALRILLTAGYELGGGNGWKSAAGVTGVVVFVLALYAAAAAMLEGALGKPVLPFGRRRRGRIAVTGGLFDQVQGIANEPGVRMQL